jgi:hypothetical protein
VEKAQQEKGLGIETGHGIRIEKDNEINVPRGRIYQIGSNLLVEFNVQTYDCN